jgi:hypothetical protein
LLSQIKYSTDIFLAFLVGIILSRLYPVLGVPHFLYVIYNFILIVLTAVLQERVERRELLWGGFVIAFLLQFIFLLSFSYVNYIFTIFILMMYVAFAIYMRWKVTWPTWGILLVVGAMIIYFPGTLFYILCEYNRLLTGNLFFLHL